MIENFEKMIEGSLQLKEPWYVAGAEFNEEESAIHIYVKVREGARFVCPVCGRETNRYEPEDESGDTLTVCFFPTYVHCRRPRIQCPHCGVKQINAPFERPNSRFTLMFEGYAVCREQRLRGCFGAMKNPSKKCLFTGWKRLLMGVN